MVNTCENSDSSSGSGSPVRRIVKLRPTAEVLRERAAQRGASSGATQTLTSSDSDGGDDVDIYAPAGGETSGTSKATAIDVDAC
eukprot:COSAG06_NODE_2885_length_6133_cov_190.874544_5_plen_84_part_00